MRFLERFALFYMIVRPGFAWRAIMVIVFGYLILALISWAIR